MNAPTPSLSLIIASMNRSLQTLELVRSVMPFLSAHDRFILVDYNDPERIRDKAHEPGNPKLVIITVPRVTVFHHTHARNCGLRECRTDLCVFADTDFYIPGEALDEIRAMQPSEFLTQPDKVRSIGFVASTTEAALAVCGWEEAFTGYGWDDCEYRMRLAQIPLRNRVMAHSLWPMVGTANVRTYESPRLDLSASTNAKIVRVLRGLRQPHSNHNRNWGLGYEVLVNPDATAGQPA